jgi:hypothetical protein
MSLNVLQRLCALVFISLSLSACVSPPTYDYSALNAAKPASVLILPPKNLSPDVNATYATLAQLSKPLAETGYYVIPVGLMDAAFKENGVFTPDDAHNITPEKLRGIFGADAALYSEITEYGNSYKLISAETAVTIKTTLVDLRSGIILWEGSARASSAEQQNNSGGGLAGLLIQAAVQQIANSIVDNSYTYAGLASQRLLAPRPAGLLVGPRSPLYGQAQKK